MGKYLYIYIYVGGCNMEIYISDSMLCSINDKLEKILLKDVYFLPNMFRNIT